MNQPRKYFFNISNVTGIHSDFFIPCEIELLYYIESVEPVPNTVASV